MFSGKKTRIAIALIALLLVSLVTALLVFPNLHSIISPNGVATPHATPPIWPVESNVELNQSHGFGISQMVAGENSSPMVVLPPGGSGTIPFTLSSPANVTFQVSLSIYPGSENPTPGVHFNIFPANFTVNPGQKVTSTLTIKADQNAPSAYYSPDIEIDTNRQSSAPYVGGGPVDTPSLLIANQVPSCLYLVNEQLIPSNVLVMTTPTSGHYTWPLFVPSPNLLPNVPPIYIWPGQTTSVMFGCFNMGPLISGQSSVAEADPLNMNVTTSNGLTAEFSPTPTNIVWDGTENIYSVTVIANPGLTPGTYQVNGQASLGSHLFDWQITYQLTIKNASS